MYFDISTDSVKLFEAADLCTETDKEFGVVPFHSQTVMTEIELFKL